MELKEFKVLEIYDTEMNVSNQKVIIIELGEVEKIELSTGRVMNMYGEPKKFLFDSNSPMFSAILEKAKNEEYVTIDISEFRFRDENRNGIIEEIAYHKNVHLIEFEESPFDSLQLNEISSIISYDLNKRLENAFESLKINSSNPIVIAHLQSNNKEVNLYLVAKDPNEKMYYGIMENEFIDKREMSGIPESNIRAIEVKEIPMQPFSSKIYIESGKKI